MPEFSCSIGTEWVWLVCLYCVFGQLILSRHHFPSSIQAERSSVSPPNLPIAMCFHKAQLLWGSCHLVHCSESPVWAFYLASSWASCMTHMFFGYPVLLIQVSAQMLLSQRGLLMTGNQSQSVSLPGFSCGILYFHCLKPGTPCWEATPVLKSSKQEMLYCIAVSWGSDIWVKLG